MNSVQRASYVTFLALSTLHAQTAANDTEPKLREAAAAELVEEALRESASLRAPGNLLVIKAAAATFLAGRDESRAAALLREMTPTMKSMIDDEESGRVELAYGPRNLRSNIARQMANRNAKLALEFFRGSRPARPDPTGSFGENETEFQLLSSLRGVSTREVQENIMRSVQREGFSYGAANAFWQQATKDPTNSGTAFHALVLQSLKNPELKEESVGARMSLVYWADSSLRSDKKSQIDPADITRLADTVARDLPTGGGTISFSTNQISAFEKYSPQAAQRLRRALAEREKRTPPELRLQVKLYEMAEKDFDGALKAVEQTSGPYQTQLYRQLIGVATQKGDFELAREVISRVPDESQREAMIKDLNLAKAMRATHTGNFVAAKEAILTLPTRDEQFRQLVELSQRAMEKDRSIAFEILSDARALLREPVQSSSDLYERSTLAQAYSNVDARMASEQVSVIIGVLDQQVNAAMVVDGFATPGRAFESGEVVLSTGVYPASAYSAAIRLLKSIASKDAEEGTRLAKQFSRPELRAAALISVAQGIMGDTQIEMLSVGMSGACGGGIF